MKIINLCHSNSSPAPEEWKESSEIKKQRPSPIGQISSLQRIDGTNVCGWFSTAGNGQWALNSDLFLVESKK